MVIQRVWQGRVSDIPAKYKKEAVPVGYTYVIIYTNNSRTYYHGFAWNSCCIGEISRVLSRCWDCLPIEMKQMDQWHDSKMLVDKHHPE